MISPGRCHFTGNRQVLARISSKDLPFVCTATEVNGGSAKKSPDPLVKIPNEKGMATVCTLRWSLVSEHTVCGRHRMLY